MTEFRLSFKTKLCAFIQKSNQKERKKILQAFHEETTSSHTSGHDATSLIRLMVPKWCLDVFVCDFVVCLRCRL